MNGACVLIFNFSAQNKSKSNKGETLITVMITLGLMAILITIISQVIGSGMIAAKAGSQMIDIQAAHNLAGEIIGNKSFCGNAFWQAGANRITLSAFPALAATPVTIQRFVRLTNPGGQELNIFRPGDSLGNG